MALDFYRLDNGDFLFCFNDNQYNLLSEIFTMFNHWTGLIIDQYGDFQLTTENLETLIRIIDQYVDTTDLNRDKKKTAAILEFKGLVSFFRDNKIDLRLIGD